MDWGRELAGTVDVAVVCFFGRALCWIEPWSISVWIAAELVTFGGVFFDGDLDFWNGGFVISICRRGALVHAKLIKGPEPLLVEAVDADGCLVDDELLAAVSFAPASTGL